MRKQVSSCVGAMLRIGPPQRTSSPTLLLSTACSGVMFLTGPFDGGCAHAASATSITTVFAKWIVFLIVFPSRGLFPTLCLRRGKAPLRALVDFLDQVRLHPIVLGPRLRSLTKQPKAQV